jgi:hypothetical protein
MSVTIESVNPPTNAKAGETISVMVIVRKPQGMVLTGYLKSYISARLDAVGGFAGSQKSAYSVCLNEEGWGDPGNRISISIGEDETEHTYLLTNKIMAECPTVEARLRVNLACMSDNLIITRNADSYIFIEDISLETVAIIKVVVAITMISMIILAAIAAWRAKFHRRVILRSVRRYAALRKPK